MDKTTLVIVVVAVIVVLAIAAATVWMYMQKKRTERLRSKFGPEYDRMVESEGDRRQAEKDLEGREKRIEELSIVSLSRDDRERFAGEWQQEQARFVDDPQAAVANADRLVIEVMRARGYPMGNFEQRAADVSVDHAKVIENYRIAHEVAVRDRRGEASTEDLRKALLHYRLLFEDLLETRAKPAEVGRR
jgi:hypothetical protein